MAPTECFDLYWLGYLLTGDCEQSVQTVIETLEISDPGKPFFEGWMTAWSRKIFISKVLGYVTPGASAAELRFRLRRLQKETGRHLKRNGDPTAGKAELERALLAIDTFPRSALLLSVFERLAIQDVAILLNADRESVKTAVAIGSLELARNVAADMHCHGTWPAHREYDRASCCRCDTMPRDERRRQHSTPANQMASPDHRSITSWAPRRYDSRRTLPVF